LLKQNPINTQREIAQAAAKVAGVKPTFTEYKGADAWKFVVSQNLHRRHLNETQRAGVAAKIANMPHGGAEYRTPNLENEKVTIPQAAKMLNVGKSTVATYRAVAAAMPESRNRPWGNFP
jgi:hypothetical protein